MNTPRAEQIRQASEHMSRMQEDYPQYASRLIVEDDGVRVVVYQKDREYTATRVVRWAEINARDWNPIVEAISYCYSNLIVELHRETERQKARA